jgi:hypothetical protein
MAVTLSEFLLARIAEDQGVAARPHESVRAERVRDLDRVEYDESSGYARLGIGRVLAECEAKRRIVAEWVAADNSAGSYPGTDAGIEMGLARAVDFLAAVYADHPDYDEVWRP